MMCISSIPYWCRLISTTASRGPWGTASASVAENHFLLRFRHVLFSQDKEGFVSETSYVVNRFLFSRNRLPSAPINHLESMGQYDISLFHTKPAEEIHEDSCGMKSLGETPESVSSEEAHQLPRKA